MRDGRTAVMLATPTGGHPLPPWVLSARAVERASSVHFEAQDAVMMTGPVQYARSRIVDAFLNDQYTCSARCWSSGFGLTMTDDDKCQACGADVTTYTHDYLLQHDDDLSVGPWCPIDGKATLDRWIGLFEEHPRLGVLGAVYLRESPVVPTIIMDSPHGGWDSTIAVGGWPDEPFLVRGVGTGFFMVRRECMQAVAESYEGGDVFRFEHRNTPISRVLSVGEDYAFCERARALDWQVAADPCLATRHFKKTAVLEYDPRSWRAKTQDAVTPMRIDFGHPGARMIEVPTMTLNKEAFNLCAVDTYECKLSEARAWATRHPKREAAE